jgi:hypothetical protein
MIIHTFTPQTTELVAPRGLRQVDDAHAFDMASATTTELGWLCTVLATKYPGQWSVSFEPAAPVSFEELSEGVDGDTWQAFMLLPGAIGADTDGLVYWLEEIYRQPVTNDNWGRVLEMFRFWYASTHPEEYVEPITAKPPKFAELELRTPAEAKRASNRRKSAARQERMQMAATRCGFGTIDQLVNAINDGVVEVVRN